VDPFRHIHPKLAAKLFNGCFDAVLIATWTIWFARDRMTRSDFISNYRCAEFARKLRQRDVLSVGNATIFARYDAVVINYRHNIMQI
jgi:hypothetical protein